MNSQTINSQKELENSAKYWRKRIKIDNDTKIYPQFYNRVNEIKEGLKYKFWAFMVKNFVDKIKEKKEYKIKIKNFLRYNNLAALLHELLHIKLGHCDKEKQFPFNLLLAGVCFDIEANKELEKYKDLLLKRKQKA